MSVLYIWCLNLIRFKTFAICFRSDSRITKKGFEVTYRAIDLPTEPSEKPKTYSTGKTERKDSENTTEEIPSKSRNSRSASSDFAPQSNDSVAKIDLKSEEGALDQSFNHFNGDYYRAFLESRLSDFSDFRARIFFEKETIRSNGHQLKDFIVQCTMNENECSLDDFAEFEDPFYGKCFSYNSIRAHFNSRRGSRLDYYLNYLLQ